MFVEPNELWDTCLYSPPNWKDNKGFFAVILEPKDQQKMANFKHVCDKKWKFYS